MYKITIQKLFIYSFLFIILFLTQASSFNTEIIDWDESTFAVISKKISEGSVLYQDYWDNKPPILFFWLSTFLKYFSNSILTIRLAGDLMIFLTLIYLFKLLNIKNSNYFESLLGCTFLIFLFSFEFAKPTLTEIPGLMFITITLYLHNKNYKNIFITGINLGLAIMSKTNIGIMAFAFLIIFIKRKYNIKQIIKFYIGVCIPFLIFSLYFLKLKIFTNFFLGIFIELFYSSESNKFKEFFQNKISLTNYDFKELLLILTLFASIFIFVKLKLISKVDDNVLLFIFLLFSIVLGRSFYNHYLILLFSFISYFLFLIVKNINSKNLNKIFFIIILLSMSSDIFIGFQNISNLKTLEDDYEIKKLAEQVANKNTLAVKDHLIYFYNNNSSPIVVHPGLYNKQKKFNEMIEILIKFKVIDYNERINQLAFKPEVIICNIECTEFIDMKYLKEYSLQQIVNETAVYELNSQ